MTLDDGNPQTRESAREPNLTGSRGRVELGQRLALPVAWVLVIVLFGILTPATFLSAGNFSTIFGSQAVLVVATMGLLIPLTAGDFDVSIGSVLTFSAMIVAVLNARMGVPLEVAVAAAIAAGVLIGSVNATLVVFFRIDPLIATLGTGTIVSGLVLVISNSMTIGGISSVLTGAVIENRVLGIPLGFYYGVALCAILWYVFEFTPYGRRLLFVGRSRNVARLSGIAVGRIRSGALVASAVIAAVAGVIYAGTTGAADPSSGQTFLLPAFAAAFLGATSIQPGRFNPWGSIIAVYFLVTGITGLQLLGAASYVQQLFYGGALVVAVILSQLARWQELKADES